MKDLIGTIDALLREQRDDALDVIVETLFGDECPPNHFRYAGLDVLEIHSVEACHTLQNGPLVCREEKLNLPFQAYHMEYTNEVYLAGLGTPDAPDWPEPTSWGRAYMLGVELGNLIEWEK